MLRLIGILVGSALAIAMLFFTLGAPRLGSVSDQRSLGSVSKPQRSAQVTDSDNPGAPNIPHAGLVTDPEPGSSETDPKPSDAEPGEPEPEPDVVLVEQLFAPEASRELVLPAEPEPVVEEHWYAFWSPFRSEIAANGFVAKLQESTGIDYRVVKVKTGVYEVAFAYTDDADVESKLERISGATGLELPGS